LGSCFWDKFYSSCKCCHWFYVGIYLWNDFGVIMTKEKTLVARVRERVGYDDLYARNAIREIAKWLDENAIPGCSTRLEQEADRYD
jgi:hypothetical protein